MNLELPEGTTVQIFIGRPVPAALAADGSAISLPDPRRARPLLKGVGVILLVGAAFYLGQHSVVRHPGVQVAAAGEAAPSIPALPRPLAVPDHPLPHVAQADPNQVPPDFQRQLQQAPNVVPPPGIPLRSQAAGAHPFGLEN